MRSVCRFLALILAGAILIGCTGKRTPPAPRSTGPLPPAPEGPLTIGTDVGQLAPDIEGPDLDDKVFRLSDYRGKVVLLDFWGHW